jgi:hypothetical protein
LLAGVTIEKSQPPWEMMPLVAVEVVIIATNNII